MQILVVSATTQEIDPLHAYLRQHWIEMPPDHFTKGNCTVRILITGVGMHRMAFALGQQLTVSKPDFCINAGIAGAYPGKAAIGDVVHVIREVIANFGAEDVDGELMSLAEMGLEEDISSQGLVNANAGQYAFLKSVQGITTNCTHGNAASIRKVIQKWDPDVESMEGAAFFYGCLKSGIPFIEIRAISNIVAPRNKEKWNIPLAIQNLSAQLIEILNFFV